MFGTVSFSFCTKRAGISGMQILPSPFGLLYHFQLLSGRSPSLYPPGLCKDSRTARFPICGLIPSKPLCFVLLDDSNAAGILSWVVAYSLILCSPTASQMFSHQAVDPQKPFLLFQALASRCPPVFRSAHPETEPPFLICHQQHLFKRFLPVLILFFLLRCVVYTPAHAGPCPPLDLERWLLFFLFFSLLFFS